MVQKTYLTEIQEVQQTCNQTKRVISPALEEILYEPIPVLDHGFVRVVDYMGDDAAIVQAARVSYGKGTKQISNDRGLIHYLMRHHHSTPFEMCELKLHVKLPMFVARQWIRHRTASVNEYSARYSILDKEFYIPSPENLASQSKGNRQGREDVLEGEEAARAFELLKRDSDQAYMTYQELLNYGDDGKVLDPARKGLARELARMNLSVNYYTQWYWKINLHNLMNFLRLRADPHAQYEIRVYAEAMIDILKRWVPLTYEAFLEYRSGGAFFSASALKVIQALLKGEPVDPKAMGMSTREWEEVKGQLGLEDHK